MGLMLGGNIIANNHEYGYKENVNQELLQAETAKNDAINAANQALSSENNAKTYAESIDPNSFVKKSGDIMTGNLTTTMGLNPFRVITSLYNDNGTADFYGSDLTIDSEDGINHFYFAGSHHTNNDTHARIIANKLIDNVNYYSEIYAGLTEKGVPYTYAPANKEDNCIVTTVSHGINYIRLGNGLQFCWGINATNTSDFNRTITLPVPYIAVGYSLQLCLTSADIAYTVTPPALTLVSHSMTNTSFSVKCNADVGFWWFTCGYYG
nr:MAG TPA: putative tail fiber protein [Caudoviricetes sp.]